MKTAIALILMTVGLFIQAPATSQAPQDAPRGQAGARGRGQGPPRGPQNLAFVDRSGKILGKIGQSQVTILDPAISPDGKTVIVRGRDEQTEQDHLYLHEGSTKRRLTTNDGNERHVFYSAKGDRIVYTMQVPGQGTVSNLFIRALGGAGTDQLLLDTPGMHKWSPSWSPDGKAVAYHNNDLATMARDIMVVDVATKKTEYLAQTPAIEAMPRFSTDGKFVAYQSEETGKFEVWVTTFPKSASKWKVSANGGIWPRWSKDEIFYWEGDAMMAVKFNAKGKDFTAGAPVKLFTSSQVGMGAAAPSGYNYFYDYFGGKFVVVQQQPAP